ncbi:LOW QUALITY PROTEIN: uncharacterized protein LOC122658673 [Telopea speciosissima]|uniref:LOW QUALITY PROTEIN: uncharacterized protein LOC122658673 n=1 Tax=Telopea speciosissima TaxID=54955 RepID=UPI001CC7EFE6|nr:LOW QUALITY PROTEIN: uncharacterized protein LOC122658673 [Telopea speciosissima]
MRPSLKFNSSPNRADKFLPPLTRFLRNNMGSQSRGRSRFSPIFIRKKNVVVAVETQEPSSPKVTCIGQVRVQRSKQSGAKNGRTSTTVAKGRLRWIRKVLLCNYSVIKPKPRASCSIWQSGYSFPKWAIAKDSALGESKREETDEYSDQRYEDEEGEEEEANVFVSSSPPKNALLLMRSRSESYRASSLANRFWGSPSPIEDAANVNREQESVDSVETQQVETEEEKPTSGKESKCRDTAAESRNGTENEEKLGFESSNSERSNETTRTGDESAKLIGEVSVRPLVLTRCKSEPARRTGKLDRIRVVILEENKAACREF